MRRLTLNVKFNSQGRKGQIWQGQILILWKLNSRFNLRIFIGTLKRALYTTQHDIFRLIRFKAFSTLHWKILILKSLSTWIGMKIFRMREKSWNFLNEIFEYF